MGERLGQLGQLGLARPAVQGGASVAVSISPTLGAIWRATAGSGRGQRPRWLIQPPVAALSSAATAPSTIGPEIPG